MRHQLFITSFIIISSITAAFGQEVEIKTWYVADAKIGCEVGDAVTSCLRIKDSLNGEYRNFSYDLEGFVHEKGFEYVIEVSQQKLQYTETDGPQYKWTLVRVISKTSTVFTDKRLLANNTFKVINIELYGRSTLAVKSKANIKFDIDSNRIYGFSGCNSFNGSCNYATAFMEFGLMQNTLITCDFQDIEDKISKSLQGRATFYVRKGMLFLVCENFMTLHLKPEHSLDSIFKVIEDEKNSVNDINFKKTEDGLYLVNAPSLDDKGLLIGAYKPTKLKPEEKNKMRLKLVPFGQTLEIKEIQFLNKAHEKPHMSYALLIYKNGKKKEVEIRDAN